MQREVEVGVVEVLLEVPLEPQELDLILCGLGNGVLAKKGPRPTDSSTPPAGGGPCGSRAVAMGQLSPVPGGAAQRQPQQGGRGTSLALATLTLAANSFLAL